MWKIIVAICILSGLSACTSFVTPFKQPRGTEIRYEGSVLEADPGEEFTVTLVIANTTKRKVKILDPRNYGWSHIETDFSGRAVCHGIFHIYDGEDTFLTLNPMDSLRYDTVYTMPDCEDLTESIRVFYTPYSHIEQGWKVLYKK